MCVRLSTRSPSVRPPVGVFLFAVGPMTAIEISDLIRFEEGREERNAQCRGILQRSRVPLVSAPRERPGSKASEKELDSSWGQTLKPPPSFLLAKTLVPLARIASSVVLAVMVRSIGSKDEIKSSPRARASRARQSTGKRERERALQFPLPNFGWARARANELALA